MKEKDFQSRMTFLSTASAIVVVLLVLGAIYFVMNIDRDGSQEARLEELNMRLALNENEILQLNARHDQYMAQLSVLFPLGMEVNGELTAAPEKLQLLRDLVQVRDDIHTKKQERLVIVKEIAAIEGFRI